MAGFGAGFGKAFGSSLEAAGKLHQEEQLRTREYERAKADRQTERLENRAWQTEDAALARSQALEDRDHEQGIKDEDNPDRVVLRGGKYYFIKRDGSEKELTSDSPLVTGYLRAKKEASQKDTLFNLTVSEKKTGIARDQAAMARDKLEMGRARQGKTLYEQLSPSEKSIIDSVALGDPTYLKGNYTGDQLKARRPSGVPKHMLPSYVELARAVQEGDIEAYRELKPVLGQIYKETPPKAK